MISRQRTLKLQDLRVSLKSEMIESGGVDPKITEQLKKQESKKGLSVEEIAELHKEMKQKDTEIAGLMKPGAKEKAIAEKMKKLEGRAQVTAEDNKKYVKMLADAEAQMWDSPVSKQEEELQK